jgi:aminoglycoside phosphotransferase (APT) family kinase protein
MAATLKPVLVISDMQAQAIIDRVAPGRTLARVGELLVGEISAVFEIEIELEGGPPAFVLKVYPEALHWKMQKEVMVARLLDGKLGVRVPRILLADDSKTLIDLSFVVMERLDGKSLTPMEPTLDGPDTRAIYVQMGRALREIHAIAMDSFGYIGAKGVLTPFPTNRAYMLSQFERKLAGFAQLAGRPELARKLEAYVERSTPLLDGSIAASLCHFDFHPGNVLAARRGGSLHLTGIVDLENAIAGDPLMDLAKTIAYSVRDDETKRAGLLAGYGTIDRPDRHERWPCTSSTVRLSCGSGGLKLAIINERPALSPTSSAMPDG